MRTWRKAIVGGLLLLCGGGLIQGQAPSPTVAGAAPQPTAQPAPAVLTKSDVDTWLDGYMPQALRSGDIPGAVVTVVKDGKILTARGFGYADVATRKPVDPERTLFRPGSVSKLVTWTAVMQQVEQGKIDLDRDVNAYLDFRIPPYQGKPVTMRQLMTHTGGFEETGKGIIFYDKKWDMPLGDYLKRAIPVRIFAPGSTPAYSNWGTALAGYIVQRTSGEDFFAYTERHVLGPIGMRQSSMRQPLPQRLVPDMSIGYKDGKPTEGFEILGPWPAGSLSASGTDMGRFMIAHLQRGEIDGQRVLKPETADMMHNSPLAKVDPFSLVPPLNRMELGFFETNVNGREVIGHLGDTEAFHTSLHLFMKDGIGFYVSFNSGGRQGASGDLRNALFMDFADRYLPYAGPADGRVDAATAKEHAKMMAGSWDASRRWQTNYFSVVNLLGQFKVATNDKGELVIPGLKGPNGRPREWVEIAPFVWRDKFGHDRLAAKVVDGKVVRWSMDFFSPFEVFDRVPASRSATWVLPALYASLGVLVLTLIAWPWGWFTRRRYKAAFGLERGALKAYRAVRVVSAVSVAVLIGWVVAFSLLLESASFLAGGLDPWLWVLQILGLIAFFGAVPIAAWNAWQAWKGKRGWFSKLWAVLLLLASLMVLYFAVTFGLVAMTVAY
ncbi:serine hydrolase domain-containing protein [Novosphingobium sp. UBA1939]|uniref:serine hydrolase domain-containing protein n=1 Tax=Novosphingobium sp. UBA1939 TaxID=1946982 RepID=UPI0025E87C8C|nr:serine hydrolase [Novosphingobium sp. UBA1939]